MIETELHNCSLIGHTLLLICLTIRGDCLSFPWVYGPKVVLSNIEDNSEEAAIEALCGFAGVLVHQVVVIPTPRSAQL